MCIYIYIYTHKHICIYIYIHVCVCVYIYIYIHTHARTFMYISQGEPLGRGDGTTNLPSERPAAGRLLLLLLKVYVGSSKSSDRS